MVILVKHHHVASNIIITGILSFITMHMFLVLSSLLNVKFPVISMHTSNSQLRLSYNLFYGISGPQKKYCLILMILKAIGDILQIRNSN